MQNNTETQLSLAVYKGDLNRIEELLKTEEGLRLITANGTNFHVINASNDGHLAITKRLLKIPAVLEKISECNSMALVRCAYNASVKEDQEEVLGWMECVDIILSALTAQNNINNYPRELLYCIRHSVSVRENLELTEKFLNLEIVRKNLPSNNDSILRNALKNKFYYAAYRILQIYIQENLPLPISFDMSERKALLSLKTNIESLHKDFNKIFPETVSNLICDYSNMPKQLLYYDYLSMMKKEEIGQKKPVNGKCVLV